MAETRSANKISQKNPIIDIDAPVSINISTALNATTHPRYASVWGCIELAVFEIRKGKTDKQRIPKT